MKKNLDFVGNQETSYLVKLMIEGVNSAMQRCLDNTPGNAPRMETRFENPETKEKILLTVTFEARSAKGRSRMSGREWPPEKIYIHQALLNSAVEKILPDKVMPDDIYRDDPPPAERAEWYHEYVQAEALADARKEAEDFRKCCAGFVGSTVRMAEQIWKNEKSQEWIKEKLLSHPSLVEFKELLEKYSGEKK